MTRPFAFIVLCATAAYGQPATPAECLAQLDKLPRAQAAEKPQRAADCIARFRDTRGPALIDLAKLYAEADQPGQSLAALQRRLAEPNLTDSDRADAILARVYTAQRGSRADDLRPRSIRAAEEVAPELERLGDGANFQKLIAYRWLTSYYRGDPDENGKVFHAASRFFELYAKVDPARQRESEAVFGLYCAYEDLAGVYSSRGENDRAKALLREGIARISTANLAKGLQKALLHYELVGQAAPPVQAPYWINTKPAAGRVDFTGKITLVEFTAHWCIPCKETYPVLERLNRRYAPRGVQVVLATSLYGYFGKDRNLTPEQELAADRKYFVEEHHVTLPVAVAPRSAEDTNSQNYGVQAIPEIVVIDRSGVVRRFLAGLGPSEEKQATDLIDQLLAPALDVDHPADAVAAVQPATLRPGGQGTLLVTLKIMEGGHANSNITEDPNLIPTSFTPAPAFSVVWGKPKYPAAETVREAYSPDPLSVFLSDSVISVPFTVAKTASSPLPLSGVLFIQVCDHDQCYPPSKVQVRAEAKLGQGREQ